MGHADHGECGAALAVYDGQAGDLLRCPYRGQPQLGTLPRRAAALVGSGVRFETHPAAVREPEARGELRAAQRGVAAHGRGMSRSEEHTSELQSPCNLVCRLLLEKKKQNTEAAVQLR